MLRERVSFHLLSLQAKHGVAKKVATRWLIIWLRNRLLEMQTLRQFITWNKNGSNTKKNKTSQTPKAFATPTRTDAQLEQKTSGREGYTRLRDALLDPVWSVRVSRAYSLAGVRLLEQSQSSAPLKLRFVLKIISDINKILIFNKIKTTY